MLLIVTIGLVLVAAVTLVIGFVSNTLAPIIVSIICSFLAAVVLSVFYRMNRGRRVATAGRPSPLVDTTPPVFSSSAPAPAPRRQGPKVLTGGGSTAPDAFADPSRFDDDRPRFAEPPVAADRPTRQFRRVPPVAAPAAPPPPPPAPAAPAAVAAPPEAPADAPAPPPRPEPLAVAEPIPGAPPAGSTSMASRPAPVGAAAAPAPTPAAPKPVAPVVAYDDSLPFPIEEYDDLRVVEIIPLLPELDDGELGAVRAYEQQNRKRLAIISRIDALLSEFEPEPEDEGVDEAEAVGPSGDDLPIADYDFLGVSEILPLLAELDEDELVLVRQYEEGARGRTTILYRVDSLLDAAAAPPAPEAAPEPPPAAPAPEPEPAAAPSAGAPLPIADYDKLRVFQILTLLAELDADELQAVRDHEQAGRGRITILNEIDIQLAGGAPAIETPAEEAAAPPPAPAPTPAPEAPAPEDEDWTGLPIADYDSLSQGEIIPLLDELYDDELDEVRDYEDANRARVAVLFRIDTLLASDEEEPPADEAEPAEVEAPVDEEPEPEPEAEAPPAEAPAAEPADEESWGEWPIADYDDLSQGEIIPLLDELYDDELEQIRDYEDANRARVAILFRIDALLAGEEEPAAADEPETEAEAEDAADAGTEAEPIAEEPAAEAADAPAAIDAAELAIADYDDLTVSEILPLLAELYDDELEDLRDYEDAHQGRAAIVSQIDALLAYEEAEPEPEDEFEDDADDEAAADEAPEAEAPQAEEPVAEEPAAKEPAAEEPAAEEPAADEPAAEEPAAEEPAAEEPAPEEPAPEEPAAEEPAPEEQAAEEAVAEEPAAEEPAEEEEYEDDEDDEFEAEDETPAGGDDDDTFPIADYDDLRVGEILPLLSQLQADELEVVRSHEEQLANRATILNRIERLLQLTD